MSIITVIDWSLKSAYFVLAVSPVGALKKSSVCVGCLPRLSCHSTLFAGGSTPAFHFTIGCPEMTPNDKIDSPEVVWVGYGAKEYE